MLGLFLDGGKTYIETHTRDTHMQRREETPINPAFKRRLERMEFLVGLIKKSENTKVDDLVGEMGLKYGLSERKIKEYLKMLAHSKRIEVDWFEGTVRAIG